MTDIPVNPELPEGFEETPNDGRPESHRVWWYRPFIRTDDYETRYKGTYTDYKSRMENIVDEIDSEEVYNQKQEENRRKWFDAFPTGIRYNVRCLDGGAWDRSTNHGDYGSLEEAEAKARELIGDSEDWPEDTKSKIKT